MALSGGFRPVVQLECTFLKFRILSSIGIVAAENLVRSDILSLLKSQNLHADVAGDCRAINGLIVFLLAFIF